MRSRRVALGSLGLFLGVVLGVPTITNEIAALPIVVGLLAIVVCAAWVLAVRRPGWFLLVVLAVVVRLPYAIFRPINDDSPRYFEFAQQLASGTITVTEHFVVEVVMALFVAVIGQAGANVASFVASVATIPVVAAIATTLFDSRRVGLMAGFAIALSPMHVWYSWWAYSEPISVLYLSVLVYTMIARRHWLTAVLLPLGLFTRSEYIVFLAVPLFVLLSNQRWSTHRLLVTASALGIGTGVLYPRFVLRTFRLPFELLALSASISIDFLFRFVEAPLEHLTRNVLFYFPHLAHWGVPYWDLRLVNPLLVVFLFVGIATVFGRRRSTVIALALVGTTIVFGTVVRELFPGVAIVGVLLLAVVFVAFFLLSAATESRTPVADAHSLLFATVPYFVFLTVNSWLAPRYFLPITTIFAVFVGYGVVSVLDHLETDHEVAVWV